MDELRNFAKVETSGVYGASEGRITLTTANLNLLPSSGSGIFTAVWYNATDYPRVLNDPNREIIQVTGTAGTNDLLVTRGYDGTTASTKNTANKTYKLNSLVTSADLNDSYFVCNPRQNFSYFNEFTAPLSTGVLSISNVYINHLSGNVIPTGEKNHPGVLGLGLGLGASCHNSMYIGSGTLDFGAGGNYDYESLIRFDGIPSADNTYSNRFGLFNSPGPNSEITDGFSISYRASNFQCVVATNGLLSSGTISMTPTTGWTKFNVTYNSNGDTVFYVNNVSGLTLAKPDNSASSRGQISYFLYRNS